MVSAWWLLVAIAVGVFAGVFVIAIVSMLPSDLDGRQIQRRRPRYGSSRQQLPTFKRH
jgi:hypothetical protein